MLLKLFTKIVKIWNDLKGDINTFSLQNRIYHSVCLAAIVIMFYNLPFSILMGYYELAAATLFLLPLQWYLFYLSRFKRKSQLSLTINVLIIHTFFIINYILNSGIRGSALLSFSIAYFLIVIVVPKKQYLMWTFIHLSLVLGLLLWEFKRPEVILISYATRTDQFTDIASTYVVSIVLMLAGLSYIINNYAIEKRLADQKAIVLKESNDQKNKLISIISHDFNTPLSSIRRYLTLLRKTELTVDERRQFENELGQVTFDTQNLLLNLLSWAHNNMETKALPVRPVKLDDALRNTVRTYRAIANEKNISFDYRIPAGTSVLGNVDIVDGILRNLINNAIKFTNEGGKVIIHAVEEDGFVIIMVEDTGIGIPLQRQPYIFNSDLSSTYGTQNEKGIGLGLTLCKDFTKALKGEIWFSSEEDQGTTFYLKLPAFSKKTKAKVPA
ncbi:Adaptive-response sensory-kinase SasA [Dyadobacter sp. CECT 9275]|uniref:histidine kinase n=1 Tax=Dyadobacter helix TaxID=2822344 RepID=A0A916JEW1_9BACT|nr:HAMP domain-containing sensor histidine kinase [Dyadobacter sp. CECT 9275]CAG5006903.1 Adaptive-response sensory-kinase SasA [Dyadobacter sp. CECT 9275]